jgi:hypothetical protein
VLERARAPRHMLPYGTWDRPIYETALRLQAKQACDLVPFDIPSKGLWPNFASSYSAAAGSAAAKRAGS